MQQLVNRRHRECSTSEARLPGIADRFRQRSPAEVQMRTRTAAAGFCASSLSIAANKVGTP